MSASENIQTIDTNEEQESQSIIQNYLNQDNENNTITIVHSDTRLESDINYIKSNNESFNKLLDAYVKNTKRNFQAKLWFKIIFFIVCVLILFGISIIMCYIIVNCLNKDISKENLIIAMINSLVSFTASFIVLPHTIADYLFNTDEEKYMTELVKNLQAHDVEIRERIQR